VKFLNLKIDVEGYDVEVIESAKSILNHCDWWREIIEFNPSVLEKRGKDAKKICEDYQKFCGFIITNELVPTETIERLAEKLPEEFSKNTFDILIGKGIRK